MWSVLNGRFSQNVCKILVVTVCLKHIHRYFLTMLTCRYILMKRSSKQMNARYRIDFINMTTAAKKVIKWIPKDERKQNYVSEYKYNRYIFAYIIKESIRSGSWYQETLYVLSSDFVLCVVHVRIKLE